MTGEVISTRSAFHWSISKLARALGVDRRTLTDRIRDNQVQSVGEDRGHPVYALADAARVLHSKAGSYTGPQDLDQFPEARKAWFQSELYRTQLEERRGELIPEADCARALAFLAKTFSGCLDALPDQLEREAGLTPETLQLVQEICDGTRERAHEVLLKYQARTDNDNAPDS